MRNINAFITFLFLAKFIILKSFVNVGIKIIFYFFKTLIYFIPNFYYINHFKCISLILIAMNSRNVYTFSMNLFFETGVRELYAKCPKNQIFSQNTIFLLTLLHKYLSFSPFWRKSTYFDQNKIKIEIEQLLDVKNCLIINSSKFYWF